ncbi:FHA domain-containing protein [Leisingera sp. ANG59]|uniref:FHA domain-containing protein n=1 Tax=Leisingera sp. ANG59 TaxID=2675221 RepID=UPI0015740332|nr:FHA domain-containing protein [Leisingera sp. ANG59]NSY41358.1 FHA domain-containing protein [Leisingera sp. ANG59]
MGFFGKLIGRQDPLSEPAPMERLQVADETMQQEVLKAVAQHTRSVELDLDPQADQAADSQPETAAMPAADAAAGIWDLDPAAAAPAAPPAGAAAQMPQPGGELPDLTAHVSAAPARKRRAKTRLLGFDTSDGDVVNLFDSSGAAAPARDTKFPVGWIVVADGPGYGESFTLKAGMSAIGRCEDQAVALDFGDTAISRSNHAAIVFDPESSQFYLGHGGKSNIVRLNGQPVISNEVLKSGDLIRLGETTLRFMALCGKDFNWTSAGGQEAEHVEIA